MRQSLFDDQPEPESLPYLCQLARKNHRLARPAHIEQYAVLAPPETG
jgi:hypothetical protein